MMKQSQSLKMLVRKAVASAGSALGVYQSRLRKYCASDHSVILMYHRIVSPESTSDYLEPGMYVRPETFSMHCKLLKQHFNVVPLAEIFKSESENSNKPRCAITFDDGWVDFLHHAFPVLEANKLPSTVYLPTSYIDTEKRFWTDDCANILKELFGKTTLPHYSGSNILIKEIIELKGDFTTIVDIVIKKLKPFPLHEIKTILTELSAYSGTIYKNNNAFLSWDEVRGLQRSGLVTFGSHTVNHLILTTETEPSIINELQVSKEKLLDQHATDPEYISFCYPNGGHSSHIAELVKNAGYASAVTTINGWISANSDLYSLKRVGMHQDMTSTKAMALSRIASC